MPPEVEPAPTPTSWGEDAKNFLEYHGLVAQKPTIRGSDYEAILHCPFRYYLTRRLGLSSRLFYSEALARGSWFHERMRMGWTRPPEECWLDMLTLLERRIEELTINCRLCGITEDKRQEFIERAEKDMRMACAWFDAMLDVPILGGPTVRERLDAPHFRLLGQEVRAFIKNEENCIAVLVCQFDALLYHVEQNSLWIFDPKTTASPTINRLKICPLEFPCQHYSYIAKRLLELGVIQREYGIPEDCTFGGMIHVAIRKPSIELSQNDRDCEQYEHTLQSGPRRGQVEIRKRYRGEPRSVNYFDRVRRWYHALEEYEDKRAEREKDPVVNVSTTYGSSFQDDNWVDMYHTRLNLVHAYAILRPCPRNFPQTASGLLRGKDLDLLHEFYFEHPKEWPGLVEQNHLMKTWRDEDLHDIAHPGGNP
jgi:hypothetical protein